MDANLSEHLHGGKDALLNRTGDINVTDAFVTLQLTGGERVERVLGVALGAVAVRASLWRALGGLNDRLPPDHTALDFCLRAGLLEGRHNRSGYMTVYVNASLVVRRSHPEGDPAAAAEESGLASLFEARWGAELEARIAARWRVALPLVWSMECGTGQVHGFTDEAITFAVALERHVDLRLEISDMWRCRETVLNTLPASTRDAVERLARRRGGRDGAILIVHRDPGRFEHFVTLGEPSAPSPWQNEASMFGGDFGPEAEPLAFPPGGEEGRGLQEIAREIEGGLRSSLQRQGPGPGVGLGAHQQQARARAVSPEPEPEPELSDGARQEARREARRLQRMPLYVIGRAMYGTSGGCPPT